MGMAYDATCQQCGHRFEVSEGGGFVFHMLHCEKRGKTKTISFDQVRQACYKGGRQEVSGHDTDVAEALAGNCRCRGSYLVDAPARCPKCRSSDFERDPDGGMLMYD